LPSIIGLPGMDTDVRKIFLIRVHPRQNSSRFSPVVTQMTPVKKINHLFLVTGADPWLSLLIRAKSPHSLQMPATYPQNVDRLDPTDLLRALGNISSRFIACSHAAQGKFS
jgi:hypothetical protein